MWTAQPFNVRDLKSQSQHLGQLFDPANIHSLIIFINTFADSRERMSWIEILQQWLNEENTKQSGFSVK